jgi:hypothetical protein
MYNTQMESSDIAITKLKEELKKAYDNITYLNKTLEMERQLYVNIRELSKDTDRKLTRLKQAYEMQIDLREALEKKIDELNNL